jgi:threonine dehydratase
VDSQADIPTLQDIREAAIRVHPFIHRTSVLTCSALNQMVDAELFFKCENFQKVGAFKIRGATNAVLLLDHDTATNGVATHSSGNHAAALSLAARTRNISAYIVMPENSSQAKKDAVAGYGAEIIFCESTLKARERTLVEVVERTGATFIPPYNDYRVIAGQATAALELLQDVPELEILMAPVGGGGLISGTALTVRYVSPKTRVVAAEPSGADDAYRSFQKGTLIPSQNPCTVADGLLTSLGDKTFPIIRDYVHEIVTVTEEGICAAMRHIWERMKVVVEPSAAVPFGSLLENKVDVAGKRVGIILSGGNVDLGRLPWA